MGEHVVVQVLSRGEAFVALAAFQSSQVNVRRLQMVVQLGLCLELSSALRKPARQFAVLHFYNSQGSGKKENSKIQAAAKVPLVARFLARFIVKYT